MNPRNTATPRLSGLVAGCVFAALACDAPNSRSSSDARGDAAPPADATALVDATTLGDAGPPADAMTLADAASPDAFVVIEELRAWCPGDASAVEARITAALAELDLDEKVAMLHGAGLGLVDGTWRVEGNPRLGLPGFRMLDGPRGVSASSGLHATAFPVAMMRGATWDPALEERVGHAMAVELLAAGGDTLLAPTINLLRHPRWGRAQETYSEDTTHMGAFAVAFIRGVQAEGVLASVKHFAANSIEDTRHFVDVSMDERTLREVYLPHFRRAVVEARAASVMSAYNKVGGLYCDLNGHLLTDILKDEWRFPGFVMSDWILGTHADADSVRAGLDLEMPSGVNFRHLPAAVEGGRLDEATLDGALRRLLRAQLCYGLDARPPVVDDARRETPEHLALAREVARRGVVLLRNEDVAGRPALPLEAASVHRLVVLGRNADVENIGDVGSSRVLPSAVVTALEGLRERLGADATVTHLPGTLLDAAGEAAVREADAVVVVTGLSADDEGESDIGAGDRASLDLRADEVALIRAVAGLQPRTIVVLEGGAATTSAAWDAEVPALLFAFYPGSEGGRALADVLFGDQAPSGRLPFSVPVDEADLPPFDNASASVTYGYLQGYRHLDAQGVPAHYPFGFGLSYTRFEHADLRVARGVIGPDGVIEATLRVTNTGEVAGVETVQLYVAARGGAVERAPQDLRAFAQVALAPGESREVALAVPVESLAVWDVEAGRFEVEPLEYELRVGAHSADPRQVATVRVTP